MTVKELLDRKGGYTFYDLVEIMKILRGEGGCPWDREQTHMSIRKNLIEETYEVVEAIDNDDPVLMCEELGDLILQAVFHAQMSAEEGRFDINDVCNGICEKLIVRHPHIFSDVVAETSDEVLKNWDAIKQQTKHQKTVTEKLNAIPPSLPALMRACKAGEKAAKVGFDFPTPGDAMKKVYEEAREVETADSDAVSEEIGDLLFAASMSRVSTGSTRKRRCTAQLTSLSDGFRRLKKRSRTAAGVWRSFQWRSLTVSGTA